MELKTNIENIKPEDVGRSVLLYFGNRIQLAGVIEAVSENQVTLKCDLEHNHQIIHAQVKVSRTFDEENQTLFTIEIPSV